MKAPRPAGSDTMAVAAPGRSFAWRCDRRDPLLLIRYCANPSARDRFVPVKKAPCKRDENFLQLNSRDFKKRRQIKDLSNRRNRTRAATERQSSKTH